MTLQLYPFQRVGVDWLKNSGRGCILADDMGTGKSVQALTASSELDAKRVLIVTLNSARRVWSRELDRWFPGTPYINIDAWEMTPQQRVEAILDKTKQYVIINYQMMLKLVNTLSRVYWDVVIFDEAHKLKNRSSQTHKASRMLTRKSTAKRVWFCTGTPVENHIEEYWPYLRVCSSEFGSYWNYAERYATITDVIHPYTKAVLGRVVENPDPNDPRLRTLTTKIREFVLRRTKEAVFPQMPLKTYARVPLVMHPDERKLYDRMLLKMSVVLPSGEEVLCDSELSQATRLLQLCVDWKLLLGEACRDFPLRGTKVDALIDNIEQLNGRPFVVFSQWSRAIDMLGNRLSEEKITFRKFTGENAETRDKDLDDWTAGAAQGLLVTIQAGGTGLDFTHASDAFFLDRSWNPKQNEQAEDRLHRHGQTRPVIVKDFFFEGSREEVVMAVLDGKTEISDVVVGELEE